MAAATPCVETSVGMPVSILSVYSVMPVPLTPVGRAPWLEVGPAPTTWGPPAAAPPLTSAPVPQPTFWPSTTSVLGGSTLEPSLPVTVKRVDQEGAPPADVLGVRSDRIQSEMTRLTTGGSRSASKW